MQNAKKRRENRKNPDLASDGAPYAHNGLATIINSNRKEVQPNLSKHIFPLRKAF